MATCETTGDLRIAGSEALRKKPNLRSPGMPLLPCTCATVNLNSLDTSVMQRQVSSLRTPHGQNDYGAWHTAQWSAMATGGGAPVSGC